MEMEMEKKRERKINPHLLMHTFFLTKHKSTKRHKSKSKNKKQVNYILNSHNYACNLLCDDVRQ